MLERVFLLNFLFLIWVHDIIIQPGSENSLLRVVWVVQLCLSLCDPMNCSPPGSSVFGILQARTLEWVAVPFSRSSQPRDRTWVSCISGRFFTIWATREAQWAKHPKNHLEILYLFQSPLYAVIIKAVYPSKHPLNLYLCITLNPPRNSDGIIIITALSITSWVTSDNLQTSQFLIYKIKMKNNYFVILLWRLN